MERPVGEVSGAGWCDRPEGPGHTLCAPGRAGGVLGRAVPDGPVSGALLAGISVAGSAPSPVNLARVYRVWETYHSKSVLLSCLEARHLFIPFSFIQSLE